MTVEVEVHTGAGSFLARAREALERREDQNGFVLGTALRVERRGRPGEEAALLVTVWRDGEPRRAREVDGELLRGWMEAFAQDARLPHRVDDQAAERCVQQGTVYLWERGGASPWRRARGRHVGARASGWCTGHPHSAGGDMGRRSRRR